MDPASVVGLVSSIITIVEFTTDVVRESHRLVQSGKKPSVLELSDVVKCQEEACKHVLAEINYREAAEAVLASEETENGDVQSLPLQSLAMLARSCVEEASRLTQILSKLAVKPRGDGKTSFGAALWSVTRARMKKKDIEDAQRKLQADVSSLLLFLVRREQMQNAVATHDFITKANGEQTQAVEKALNDTKSELEAISMKCSAEQEMFLDELRTKIREHYGSSTGVFGHDEANGKTQGSGAQPLHRRFNQPGLQVSREKEYAAVKEQNMSSARAHESQLGYEEQQRAKREKKAIDRILQSLDFAERTQRQAAIQDAHHTTFEWMFKAGSSPIQNWAESDRGIFWVNGKAGSGKSTLMKYASSHAKTKELLRKWAERELPKDVSYSLNNTLTVSQIYFWYLGTDLQRSEEGLLRSMLHQILSASRDLIPIAAADRWEAATKAINSTDPWEVDLHLNAASVPWTLAELRASLDKVAECTSDRRFAFFIDGLDEYKADHHGLAQLLQNLARNPDFKFCASSRPWNAFVNAFGSQEDVFVLEDHTSGDIRKYVYARLAKHTSNQPQLETLCSEVVAKAQGVFLWVTLTVRSLLEGLEENDNVRILRRRVDELPSDLGEYFDVILSRVHKVYRDQTATALWMAHRAAQRDLLQDPSWELPIGHHRSFLNLWLLQQGFESEDFALTRGITEVTVPKCHDMVLQTKRFISACCKDLLCVPKPPPAGDNDEQTYITQYKFEFLHRTVYEYLNEPSVMARLERSIIPHVKRPEFDTMLTIARLSCVPIHSGGRCRFLDETLKALVVSAPLDKLDTTFYTHLDGIAARYVEYCLCSQHDSTRIHEILVSRRQYTFTAAVMRKSDGVAFKDGSTNQRPLLCSALGLSRSGRLFPIDQINFSFVDAYLLHAVGINFVDEVDDLSVWDRFLADWHRAAQNGHAGDAAQIWAVAKRFVQAGVDISKRARGIQGNHSTIKTLTGLIPPGHQYELHDLIAVGKPLSNQKQLGTVVIEPCIAIQLDTTEADKVPDRGSVKQKSSVLIKPPTEQSAEEIEFYFRMTGFRP
ncbi:hypothetical protein CBER1_07632 [Cercospora berteroae]|uniref:NACHT domain-containing protein n=1 Tax=Cercospora berteroae TaxID=357750 RepID=A0A2S6C9R5_9PEZI|nr:hypothetical protein CBER1_07632 [Cercospora berteroae]